MDLKIKDVASLLNVSETTVRRWLLAGKIPAYRLNHQYRFSRMEIEDWLLRQKLEEQKRPHPPHRESAKALSGGNQQFCLYRALHKGRVIRLNGERSKGETIQTALIPIAEDLNLDPELVSDLILSREKLMPTGLNQGIALPHAREPIARCHYDHVSAVFLEKPLEWGALDGLPVHTLFFLFAKEDKTHLHLIAKIAHLSSNREALQLFKTRPAKEVLLDFVKEWEKKMPPLS